MHIQTTELWVSHYLVAYRKILAVLSAPTDPAVQAFVHIAVLLIWLVSAVILPVAQIPLRNAAAIGAHEEGAVAQASWKRVRHDCHWHDALPFLNKARECVWPDSGSWQINSCQEVSPGWSAFLFPAYAPTSFLGECCCRWHWWRDSSWEPNSSLTCSQTFEVERQFVRVVGAVCVAVTLPLRAEKAAAVPTAKFLWTAGAIHCRRRALIELHLNLAVTKL